MSEKEDKKIKAECRSLERIGRMVLGESVTIRPIPRGINEIGYTTIEKQCYVYLNFGYHEVVDGLSEVAKVVFRKGVAAHEFLHRLLTDYDATNEALESVWYSSKKTLLMTYLNIVEDPAIEHFAHTQFSGLLLKALYFMIACISKASPDITVSPTPLSQYLNALIQFGDVGIIKGEFTFPDAEKAFYETVDMFYEAICEPISAKRIEIAKEMFHKTKYLWEDEVDTPDFQSSLDASLPRKSSSCPDKSNPAMKTPSPDESDERSSKVEANRKKTLSKLKKEKSEEEEGKNSSSDSGEDKAEETSAKPSGKGDATEDEKECASGSSVDGSSSEDGCDSDKEKTSSSKSTDKDEAEDEEFSSSEENAKDKDDGEKSSSEEDVESEAEDENNGEDEDESESEDENKDEGDEENTSLLEPNDEEESGEPSSAPETDTEGEEYWSFDIDEMLDELRAEVVKDIYDEVEKIDREALADINDEPIETCDEIYGIGTSKNVIYTPQVSDEIVYNEILSELEPTIRRVVHSLKAVLAMDRQKIRPHNSGKIKAENVYLSGDYITRKGRITENIFDKKILPKDKSDLAVAVAVDLSGSMSCPLVYSKSRAEVARECAIALAEIFHELNIPIYIMGFDADTGYVDTRHHHFVRWKNTASERKTLARITYHDNNRDGASIRYLTKILKKRNARHKLMIVISDGTPLAIGYQGEPANADTKRAVEEAKSKFPVLGISIGADESILKSFYGNDFIIAKNGNDLLFGIVGKLKKILK